MPVCVRVRYFAGLATVVGCDEESVSAVTTVQDVVDRACEKHPGLVPHRGTFRVAKNVDFVDGPEALAEGDVIALLPPFSGG